MPPESVQRNFTGTAGDDALRLAFDFYRLVHRLIERHATAPVETILDFGCGWGRILRFFMRDVAEDSLIGIDCLQEAVDLCHATNPHCRVDLVPALQHLRFGLGQAGAHREFGLRQVKRAGIIVGVGLGGLVGHGRLWLG